MENMKSCNCSNQVKTRIPKRPATIRIIDEKHRVGCTIPFLGNVFKTVTQPISQGSYCVQFYLGPTSRYKCETITKNDKGKTIQYCDTNGKKIYVHCPNNTNLARDYNHHVLKGTRYILEKELNQIKDMPASCIAHIGSVGTIQNVVDNINDLNIERGTHHRAEKQFILENAAGAGTKLGKNLEELRHIFEGIDINTVGLCIDTQHTFASGMNRLSSHEDIVKLFDACESVYGRNPDVIHLNDSKINYGGRVDRHEGLKDGYIWNESDEGLKTLLDYCYENHVDVILETPASIRDLEDIRENYMDLETVKNDVNL